MHARRLPGRLGRRSARPSAGVTSRPKSTAALPRHQAGGGRYGERGSADQSSSQLPGGRVPSRRGGRRARLPAQRIQVEGRPNPVLRLLAKRADLPPYRARSIREPPIFTTSEHLGSFPSAIPGAPIGYGIATPIWLSYGGRVCRECRECSCVAPLCASTTRSVSTRAEVHHLLQP